jgi:hypothetical protein
MIGATLKRAGFLLAVAAALALVVVVGGALLVWDGFSARGWGTEGSAP